MNGNALKLGLVMAAAVVVVALLGMRFLPNYVGGPPNATPIPTPTAVTLASGSFTAPLNEFGEAIDIEALRTGDEVSGTMEISNPTGGDGAYSVDVQCARATDSGPVFIGGEVTDSTYEAFVGEGAYVVLAFLPGTPVRLLWAVDVLATDDVAAAADSCEAFLDTLASDPQFVDDLGVHGYPIQGELELGR